MLKFRKNNSKSTTRLAETTVCAVSIGLGGSVVDNSSNAFPLLRAWKAQTPEIVSLFEAVKANRSVAEERMTLPDGTRYSLTGIYFADRVMITARDTTVSDRMTEALLQSRGMFKGLLDRAVDFCFEVDSDRVFRFVSPDEAFDQKLAGWIGRSADEIFWPNGKVPSRNPFASKKVHTFDAVQIDFGLGTKYWVSFTVEPVQLGDNKIAGVRGVCRDVSSQVASDRQTRMDNLRLSVQQRIVSLINTTDTSEMLLDSASSELMDVLRADLVWSVVKFPEGLVPAAICGESPVVPNIEDIWQKLALAADPIIQVQDDDNSHLAVRLEEGGIGIGMFVICRDTATYPWAEHEKSLLADITGSLAAAFGKAQLINKLQRLSSLDELTGIMNRRAFVDSVERRLRHQCRSGQSGCLLFVDLDHFKEVNDTLGHKAGDTAIKMVADRMQTLVRSCDLVGRYGGDEFVLWLEDISPNDAALKAMSLIDSMPKVRETIGADQLKLSASVGVCASTPGLDLKFVGMAERADAALYEVKNAGRSNVAIAPSADGPKQVMAGGMA